MGPYGAPVPSRSPRRSETHAPGNGGSSLESPGADSNLIRPVTIQDAAMIIDRILFASYFLSTVPHDVYETYFCMENNKRARPQMMREHQPPYILTVGSHDFGARALMSGSQQLDKYKTHCSLNQLSWRNKSGKYTSCNHGNHIGFGQSTKGRDRDPPAATLRTELR